MSRRLRLLAAVAVVALALAARAQEPAGERQQEEDVVLGRSAALGSETAEEERVDAEAGSQLLQYPDPTAPLVEVLPARVELPVLERSGDWVAVRYRALKLWLALVPQPETPAFELPPLYEHEGRLRQARALLGADERALALGPFTLYSDVEEEALLDRIVGSAADLQRAYTERYGLRARLLGNETIVLFRDEEDYRRNEGAEPAIGGLEAFGHASSTIAVLAVGDRRPAEVRQLLLHELTHLLNRRALARALPPWLEEGLAEDLSYSAIDHRGRLDPVRLSGRSAFTGDAQNLEKVKLAKLGGWGVNPWGSSPRAGMAWLLHNWKSTSRPSLERLVDLPWLAFVEPGYRGFHYAESGFLVRYLLDEGSGLAPRLRALLAEIAAGEEPTRELFWSRLDLTPRELEEGFYTWLWAEAAAHGVPRPMG